MMILMLAQLCASEAGIAPVTNDCPAIHAVITRRAEVLGVSWPRAARAYAGNVFNRRRTDSRRWIAWLRPDARKPHGWPSSARWRPSAWKARLDESARIWSGELTHACNGRPDHWGGRHVDHARIVRGIRRGYWRRLDCGPTLNVVLEVLR
jgi:hypothetical protein